MGENIKFCCVWCVYAVLFFLYIAERYLLFLLCGLLRMFGVGVRLLAGRCWLFGLDVRF